MARRNYNFNSVQTLNPGRSLFNLSHSKLLTCDMGELIPTMCDEMVPGDIFSIGNEAIIRMLPLVAPVLHEINVFFHYFFVPYRILWDEWEDFITGGPDGDLAPALPRWEPTNTAKGSLWDYLGLPVGVDPDGAYPVDFIRRAYNFIYNEYYRDEELINEVDLDNEDILLRAWEKDYFTSSLLEQQRGTAPALPISGTTSAVWSGNLGVTGSVTWPSASGQNFGAMNQDTVGNVPYDATTQSTLNANTFSGNVPQATANNNTVDLSSATTFDIADLRLAFQIQRFLERNNRCGARYTEFLRAHFGVAPRDDRLQRPEWIGGVRYPVIVSEVLQTSATVAGGTAQGTMTGHGITVDRKYVGKYHAQEFGVVIGIMSIMPRPAYQQGIERQWLPETRYDYCFPEFAHLSEQAVTRAEIYATDVEADNLEIFGYQGRYDHMRYKRNMVCADMRDTFDYWHLGRQFSSAPELNQDFIECVPDKRIFAIPAVDGFLVNVGNIVKALRPIPAFGEPGLIDHN